MIVKLKKMIVYRNKKLQEMRRLKDDLDYEKERLNLMITEEENRLHSLAQWNQ